MRGPFRKVLVANRGEIACRVMRTCKRLEIATVAVYSDADAHALHVQMADQAIHVGPSQAAESYLSIDKILSAAKQAGAEAIHPGYGFLSENEKFAQACLDADLVFIGPPPAAIKAMGSKSAAKALMARAGVPLTPGYHGDQQSPEFLREQADALGYPVLIKASAGGGGKGMRRVDRSSDFSAALSSCKREAFASFGDDRVLIETLIQKARHIEIQVFADSYGEVVSLFERDCSVQRRHQKVLEEAPAPGLTEEQRFEMGIAACDAARAVGYVGAGTVEFIADLRGRFHFMEMNTRLQVEHPVTEMITGLDLVEWQLRIGAGERLPLRQEQIGARGHAIEARIYAEDPANGFMPSTGTLTYLGQPVLSEHVRVDTGVQQGDQVTAFYDPLLAKLIVWEPSRAEALGTLHRALGQFQSVGVKTNIGFLRRLIATDSLIAGRLSTELIEQEAASLFAPAKSTPELAYLLAALYTVTVESQVIQDQRSPWAVRDGWRLSSHFCRALRFISQGEERVCSMQYVNNSFLLEIAGNSVLARGALLEDGRLEARLENETFKVRVVSNAGLYTLFAPDGDRWELTLVDPLKYQPVEASEDHSFTSPMPGLLRMLLVRPGERVEKGTALLVLEAMKMEYTIEAPTAGTVAEFLFEQGEQVGEGALLLKFESDTSPDA